MSFVDAARCWICGAKLDPGLDWCPQCLARRGAADKAENLSTATPISDLPGKDILSRWRAGSVSFGPWGKLLITLVVAGVDTVGLLVAYQAVTFGRPGWAFVLFYLGVALFASGFFLRNVWTKAKVGVTNPSDESHG